MSKPLSYKSSLYTRNKGLYYPYAQVNSALKVGFFPGLKMWRSNHSQTLRLAFIADFSGILQLENTTLGPGNTYLMGVTLTYINKEHP